MAITNSTAPAPRVVFNFAGLDLVAENPHETNLHAFADELVGAVQMALEIETLEEDASFTSSEASTLYELLRVAREAYDAARSARLGGAE